MAPRSSVVPSEEQEKNRREHDALTLGDVLYADEAKARAPETEWVALVRSIAGGDQLALQMLYERTHRIVYTLSLRITSNRETAEEVTLDVFHDVWRRASKYDPADGSVVGWIMNQARSRAIDRLRFEQRKKRANPDAGGPVPVLAEEPPHERIELQEECRIVREALVLLTEGERRAIETAFFSELTYAEAAARLNQPIGTIKTRIRSGLDKLRRALGHRREKQ